MNGPVAMQTRVMDYLAERRRLGFELQSAWHCLDGLCLLCGFTGSWRATDRWPHGWLGPMRPETARQTGDMGEAAQAAQAIHPLFASGTRYKDSPVSGP